jgi:hypothetical protein
MRGLKSFDCAKGLPPAVDAMRLIERRVVAASCSGLPHFRRTELYARLPRRWHRQSGSANTSRTGHERTNATAHAQLTPYQPTPH